MSSLQVMLSHMSQAELVIEMTGKDAFDCTAPGRGLCSELAKPGSHSRVQVSGHSRRPLREHTGSLGGGAGETQDLHSQWQAQSGVSSLRWEMMDQGAGLCSSRYSAMEKRTKTGSWSSSGVHKILPSVSENHRCHRGEP